MPIWLEVNPHGGIPLYVQLVQQIKRAVQVGILQPGDPLPTVRGLAAELHIALNTIVKAYGELEAFGHHRDARWRWHYGTRRHRWCGTAPGGGSATPAIA